MRARRTESIVALVVAAAGVLLTFVFGFLSFTPGVDPEVAAFLEFGFFGGGILTLGAVVAYFLTSRRAGSGQPPSRFDRLLEQRAAALAAVPVGLVAVLIGALWFLTKTLSEGGIGPGPDSPAVQTFAAIDTAGIGAFLGLGSLYVIVATWVAIRAERAAIRAAREDLEVKTS